MSARIRRVVTDGARKQRLDNHIRDILNNETGCTA